VRNEADVRSWPNHELSRFVQAGGIRWHVQQMGQGPRLLLVHGTGASTHSWRDIIRPLGARFSVLAPDLPGHAFTAQSPGGGSIAVMTDALAQLLDELQFSPDYVVGHSAGAVILCSLALAGRIVPRVIISINGAFLPLQGFAGWLFSPIAKLLAGNSLLPRLIAHRAEDSARVERVLRGTGSVIDPQGVEYYCRLTSDPTHLAGTLRMMADWDLHVFTQALPQLRVPLILLVADNDCTVPPRQAQTVHSLVANSRIVSLPRLGHLAHEENPALITAEIVKICESYPPP
jgi:magnesium chelatase accessory protein